MKKGIITAILIGLAILFGALETVWYGFLYFAGAFLALLSLFWVAILVINFLDDYYVKFDEGFKRYKAETVNYHNVTTEDFENNIEFHLHSYKKSLRPYKAFDIFKILFIFTLFVLIIVALFNI